MRAGFQNRRCHAAMAQPFGPRVPVVLESEHYGPSKERGAWGDGSLLVKSVEAYHAAYMSIHWWPRIELEENRAVIDLSHAVRKPLLGGGDSHLLTPSCALSASRAATYGDFVAEVRSGCGRPIVTAAFFVSLRWKLLLRVLTFISHYRRIAQYRGEPVERLLQGRWVLLDPIAWAARVFVSAAGAFGRLA